MTEAQHPRPRPVQPGGTPEMQATPNDTTGQPGRAPRRLWIVGAVLLIVAAGVVVLVIALSGSNDPKPFTARGTFQVTGSVFEFTNEDGTLMVKGTKCQGVNGYEDIVAGAQVTVSDENGKTLAIGSLPVGHYTSGQCTFAITIDKVPAGHKFYRVEVAHRGTIQFTEKQMRDGEMALSLGN